MTRARSKGAGRSASFHSGFAATLRQLGIVLLIWTRTALGSQAAEPASRWPFDVPGPVVAVPSGVDRNWVRNEIDCFVGQKLAENGLQPAPEAAPRTLLRRLYLDLLGVPPTPEEIDEFVHDSDPAAYAKRVDRLLADPRYGERWARFWLDLARYADTAGYEGDPDWPHAWRYRDYVIDAFNNDKPYDLFIREQIAGDELDEIMGAGDLPDVPPERVVALTFLRLAPFTEPRGDESRHELLSEMTATVGSVFLGLTVGCAKCHDHKHDDIPTADFYRMQAFFATVQIPRPARGDVYQIGGPLDADFYRPGEQERVASLRAELAQQDAQADEQLATLLTAIAKRLAENAAAGQPLSAAPTGNEDVVPAQVDAGDERDLRFVDTLVQQRDPRVTLAEQRRYEYLSTRHRFVQQHLRRLQPLAMSLRHSYGPPYEPGVPTSRIMLRGEHDQPGEIVEPGFLSAITRHVEPAAIRLDPFKRWPTRSRRLALADWIAQRDNPLTARVMVNRLWHWHFGQGIVTTPSDFGHLSGGPSHRELLDWLAVKFIDAGWSTKTLHRVIVNSATYRQSSAWDNPRASELDPDNRLLWRFNPRRLEAEAIRDNVLAVSGRLNGEQFGLPIFPPLPGDVADAVKYGESKWDTQYGPAGRKRSIYIYQQRTLTMPLLQTFDALVCDESRPRRTSSVTPLQALAMYNGDFVNEEAQHFAARVRSLAPDDTRRQIRIAFELALGRTPADAEYERIDALMQRASPPADGLVSVCRVLFNTNEFVYVD